MRDVTGLFVVAALFLIGRTRGIEKSSGYCIGNQCFSVFQEPGLYNAAQDRCGELGGHLMTVRSTVSNDVIFILLENLKGRFWIGLRRSADCPDAAAKLRGFQWVTSDNETDFSNWASGFDGGCSSHRCVSVSKDSDLKWTQEPCDEPADGFLCEVSFSKSCKGIGVSEGESVTYSFSGIPIGGEDVQALPPGSIAIRMPAENKFICFSETWLQAPWSCEIEEGGCEHRCAVDPKQVPSCYCPSGQAVSPANKVTCEVVAEDPCAHLGCAHACYQNGNSHACLCDHGFKLAQDGRSCVDFNDCKDERQCPGENFACVNTIGGFQCVCGDGYRMTGGLCVDVDECVSAPCEHLCANTPGGYQCSCYHGYIADSKLPNKCKLHCGKQECPAECDPNDRYLCYCPEGYIAEERGANTVCIDMDECSFFYCEQGCTNTFGGYACHCFPGNTLVDEYRCEKNEDDPDTDGGAEGSGASTTENPVTTTPAARPQPTRRPPAVTVGAFVGIIVATVFVVVSVVCLAHHVLYGRRKMGSAGALKASEDEAHVLRRVKSDT